MLSCRVKLVFYFKIRLSPIRQSAPKILKPFKTQQSEFSLLASNANNTHEHSYFLLHFILAVARHF